MSFEGGDAVQSLMVTPEDLAERVLHGLKQDLHLCKSMAPNRKEVLADFSRLQGQWHVLQGFEMCMQASVGRLAGEAVSLSDFENKGHDKAVGFVGVKDTPDEKPTPEKKEEIPHGPKLRRWLRHTKPARLLSLRKRQIKLRLATLNRRYLAEIGEAAASCEFDEFGSAVRELEANPDYGAYSLLYHDAVGHLLAESDLNDLTPQDQLEVLKGALVELAMIRHIVELPDALSGLASQATTLGTTAPHSDMPRTISGHDLNRPTSDQEYLNTESQLLLSDVKAIRYELKRRYDALRVTVDALEKSPESAPSSAVSRTVHVRRASESPAAMLPADSASPTTKQSEDLPNSVNGKLIGVTGMAGGMRARRIPSTSKVFDKEGVTSSGESSAPPKPSRNLKLNSRTLAPTALSLGRMPPKPKKYPWDYTQYFIVQNKATQVPLPPHPHIASTQAGGELFLKRITTAAPSSMSMTSGSATFASNRPGSAGNSGHVVSGNVHLADVPLTPPEHIHVVEGLDVLWQWRSERTRRNLLAALGARRVLVCLRLGVDWGVAGLREKYKAKQRREGRAALAIAPIAAGEPSVDVEIAWLHGCKKTLAVLKDVLNPPLRVKTAGQDKKSSPEPKSGDAHALHLRTLKRHIAELARQLDPDELLMSTMERQAEVSSHKDVLHTQSQALEKAVSEMNVKVSRDSVAREMYEEVAARVKFQASGLSAKSLESRKHTMMLMGELLAHFRALEGLITESIGYAMEVTSAEVAALSGDMQLENQDAVKQSASQLQAHLKEWNGYQGRMMAVSGFPITLGEAARKALSMKRQDLKFKSLLARQHLAASEALIGNIEAAKLRLAESQFVLAFLSDEVYTAELEKLVRSSLNPHLVTAKVSEVIPAVKTGGTEPLGPPPHDDTKASDSLLSPRQRRVVLVSPRADYRVSSVNSIAASSQTVVSPSHDAAPVVPHVGEGGVELPPLVDHHRGHPRMFGASGRLRAIPSNEPISLPRFDTAPKPRMLVDVVDALRKLYKEAKSCLSEANTMLVIKRRTKGGLYRAKGSVAFWSEVAPKLLAKPPANAPSAPESVNGGDSENNFVMVSDSGDDEADEEEFGIVCNLDVLRQDAILRMSAASQSTEYSQNWKNIRMQYAHASAELWLARKFQSGATRSQILDVTLARRDGVDVELRLLQANAAVKKSFQRACYAEGELDAMKAMLANLPESMVTAARLLRAKQHALVAEIVEAAHRRSMASFQDAQCTVLKTAEKFVRRVQRGKTHNITELFAELTVLSGGAGHMVSFRDVPVADGETGLARGARPSVSLARRKTLSFNDQKDARDAAKAAASTPAKPALETLVESRGAESPGSHSTAEGGDVVKAVHDGSRSVTPGSHAGTPKVAVVDARRGSESPNGVATVPSLVKQGSGGKKSAPLPRLQSLTATTTASQSPRLPPAGGPASEDPNLPPPMFAWPEDAAWAPLVRADQHLQLALWVAYHELAPELYPLREYTVTKLLSRLEKGIETALTFGGEESMFSDSLPDGSRLPPATETRGGNKGKKKILAAFGYYLGLKRLHTAVTRLNTDSLDSLSRTREDSAEDVPAVADA